MCCFVPGQAPGMLRVAYAMPPDPGVLFRQFVQKLIAFPDKVFRDAGFKA